MADESFFKNPKKNTKIFYTLSKKTKEQVVRRYQPSAVTTENLASLLKKGEESSALAENNKSDNVAYRAKLQEALQHYQTAAELYPTDPIAFYHIGVIQKKSNNCVEAIQNYTKAIQRLEKANEATRKTYLSHAYSNRGVANQELDNLTAAEEDWKAAINLQAEFYQPYMGMALLKEKTGNITEAEEYCKNALKYTPEEDITLRAPITKKYNALQQAQRLKDGDKFYEEVDYLKAKDCYTAFIKNEENPENHPDVFYKRAHSNYMLLSEKKHDNDLPADLANQIKDDAEKALTGGLNEKYWNTVFYYGAFAEHILKNYTEVIKFYNLFRQSNIQDEKFAADFEKLYTEAQNEIKKCTEKMSSGVAVLITNQPGPLNSTATHSHDNKNNTDNDALKHYPTTPSPYPYKKN